MYSMYVPLFHVPPSRMDHHTLHYTDTLDDKLKLHFYYCIIITSIIKFPN